MSYFKTITETIQESIKITKNGVTKELKRGMTIKTIYRKWEEVGVCLYEYKEYLSQDIIYDIFREGKEIYIHTKFFDKTGKEQNNYERLGSVLNDIDFDSI